MDQYPIPPELAARITAADATAKDFRAATDADAFTSGAPEPDWADWAFRLAASLESLLGGLEDTGTGAGVAQPGGGWISGPSL